MSEAYAIGVTTPKLLTIATLVHVQKRVAEARGALTAKVPRR